MANKKVPTRYKDFEIVYDRAAKAIKYCARPSDFGFDVTQSGELFVGNLTPNMRRNGVQHGMQFDVTRQGQPMGEANQGFGQHYGGHQPKKLVDVPHEKPQQRDDEQYHSRNRCKPF